MRGVEYFPTVIMEFRNFLNFVLSSLIIYVFLKVVPYVYNVFIVLSSAVAVMKLAEWLMTSTRKYFLYKTVSPKNKAVLITGKFILLLTILLS